VYNYIFQDLLGSYGRPAPPVSVVKIEKL